MDYWDIIGDINLKPDDLRNALLVMMIIGTLLKLTCSNQGKLSALLSCHPIRTGNEFGFELKLIKTIILNSPGIEVVLGKLLWETQVIVVRVRAQKLQMQIQSQSSCKGKLDIKSIQRLTNSGCLLT